MGHPVFESRSQMLTWWMVWILLAPGHALLLYYSYDGEALMSITDGFVSMMVYSALALAVWFPFRYFNRSGKSNVSRIINMSVMALAMTSIWLMLSRIITGAFFPDSSLYDEFWTKTMSYRIASGLFICGLVILTYYLIISYRILSEKKLDEVRMENLLRETELRMLRTQINPHFLFNSLNSVSSLTITNPEKAREMVMRLSDFMRYSLSRKDEQPVTIRQELENLRLYLEIEKTRFGNRLLTREEISEECLEVRIPSLLLQPLYENAVKYGVHESTGTVTITTSLRCTGQLAEISISNNFDPESIPPAGTGTGLNNVKRRLELVYGRSASLTTEKGEGTFTVNLTIPVKI